MRGGIKMEENKVVESDTDIALRYISRAKNKFNDQKKNNERLHVEIPPDSDKKIDHSFISTITELSKNPKISCYYDVENNLLIFDRLSFDYRLATLGKTQSMEKLIFDKEIKLLSKKEKDYLKSEACFSKKIVEEEKDIFTLESEKWKIANDNQLTFEEEILLDAMVNAAYRNGKEGDLPEGFISPSIRPTFGKYLTSLNIVSLGRVSNFINMAHEEYSDKGNKKKLQF